MTEAEDMDARSWIEKVAACGVAVDDLPATAPRPLKLTIADLELLDRSWNPNPIHSTELIDGRIYFTPARFRPRARATSELSFRIMNALTAIGSPYACMMRGSIAMSPHDLPLPDIVLTDAPRGPGFIPVGSVPLVIEVAETAPDFFIGDKARLYARHGVPEYWVIDLQGRAVHRMWMPGSDGYGTRNIVAMGERVEAMTLANLAVETDDV